MPSCPVIGCRSRPGKHYEGVTFHKFPWRRPDILEEWITFVNRAQWKPNWRSTMCSLHFMKQDFSINLKRRSLKKTAVPTIANPEGPDVKPIKRKSFVKRPKGSEDYYDAASSDSEHSKVSEPYYNSHIPQCKVSATGKDITSLDKWADSLCQTDMDVMVDAKGRFIIVPSSTPQLPTSSNGPREHLEDAYKVRKQRFPPRSDSLEVSSGPVYLVASSEGVETSTLDPSSISKAPPLVCYSSLYSLENLDFKKSGVISPEEVKIKRLQYMLNAERQKLIECRKKVKVVQHQKSRLIKRLAKKDTLLNEFKKSNSKNEGKMLEGISETSACLIKRQMYKQEINDKMRKEYDSEEFRSFCTTLYRISHKAYMFVREKFDLCLPDQRTIRRWGKNLNTFDDSGQNSGTELNNDSNKYPEFIISQPTECHPNQNDRIAELNPFVNTHTDAQVSCISTINTELQVNSNSEVSSLTGCHNILKPDSQISPSIKQRADIKSGLKILTTSKVMSKCNRPSQKIIKHKNNITDAKSKVKITSQYNPESRINNQITEISYVYEIDPISEINPVPSINTESSDLNSPSKNYLLQLQPLSEMRSMPEVNPCSETDCLFEIHIES